MTYVFIISTYGGSRAEKFTRLIKSICAQSSKSSQILIIHILQGRDCIYFDIACSMKFQNIEYIAICDLHVGLSRGRNIALEYLAKDKNKRNDCTIFFSDDDCFYPPGFIKKFKEIQAENTNVGVAGLVMDETITYPLSYSSQTGKHVISKKHIFRNISSINFGVPYDSTRFDELFGIGGKFNSCEEFDYIARRLKKGLVIKYDSNFYVCHPDVELLIFTDYLHKIYKNSIGHGAYFRKHFGIESLYYVFANPFLSFLKNLFLLRFKSASGSIIGFFGRCTGFFKF